MAIASRATILEPFRFLDLPKDIRLMVYERLPRSTNHLRIIGPSSESAQPSMTLITHSTPTAILRASHQVYQEALPLVNKAIREWVEDGGVKIINTTRNASLYALWRFLRVLLDVYKDLNGIGRSKLPEPQSASVMHATNTLDNDARLHILEEVRRALRSPSCFVAFSGITWIKTHGRVAFERCERRFRDYPLADIDMRHVPRGRHASWMCGGW